MQESVTLKHKINKQKNNIKYVIFTVLFFFLIFLIFTILVVSKKSNLIFDAKTFYIVYAEKNKNSSVLYENQSKIKNMGGAGIVVEKNNEYYLAVSIYLTKDDAKEIVNNLSLQFSNAGIVEFSSSAISNKVKTQIKKDAMCFELYKIIYNFFDEYQELMFLFAKGEIGEGKFMSSLVAKKLEIEKQKIEYIKDNEFVEFEELLTKIISHFDYLFSKFYAVEIKESLCYEFFIYYCQTFIEFCKKIN